MEHVMARVNVDGMPGYRLEAVDAQVCTTFVPAAGMVGISLVHKGAELLPQQKGLKGYRRNGSTFGIPLLHPWGNRLQGDTYNVAGTEVDLKDVGELVHRDSNGLPIHGLGTGRIAWTVTETTATDSGARLVATADFGRTSPLFKGFPFSHCIEQTVTLAGFGEGACLAMETQLKATGKERVPVVFGWHPYLRLPGVSREDWVIDLPVHRHYRLSNQSLPTGERESCHFAKDKLGSRVFDDLFDQLKDSGGAGGTFTLSGGRRRLSVCFERGYPYAIVWAPPGQELICFEPMTAATNALASAWPERLMVAPGESYSARFSIRVDDRAA